MQASMLNKAMAKSRTIYIAAALLTRPDGATLLVRKRGTRAFMQPGGKIDAHEQPVRALCRELSEELNLIIEPSDAKHIGRFIAPAANETGHIVIAEIFHLSADIDAAASAEIEEVRWVMPEEALELELAPLTRNHLLPLVRRVFRAAILSVGSE